MKKTLFLLALLASTSALAQEGLRIRGSFGAARLGAGCSLWVEGLPVIRSTCDVGRLRYSPTTEIQIGNARLRVVRSSLDDTEATMLFYDSDEGRWRRLGSAVARGACWVGSRMQFCAD